jgi:hypothetical protein
MERKISYTTGSTGHIAVVLVSVSLVMTTFTEIGIEMGEEVAILFYLAMAVLSFYVLSRAVVAAEKIVG